MELRSCHLIYLQFVADMERRKKASKMRKNNINIYVENNIVNFDSK